MVMALLGVTIGNTDGGILDLLIFGVMQGMSTKWYLLFPVGMASVCYLLLRLPLVHPQARY